ncbi:MAG TPA: hypothetical protein VFV67_24030 [Actinophytocola sp.]|uniref:hypothetical protein n=1 Tax=Actinophytocola sp. TaxID=1872138 RepID=UPI002DBAAF4B|nr:hypothetical protein [Actinophytocola sp.]HEU5473728.1 hypothetical protein [Actinophytocola sp.]
MRKTTMLLTSGAALVALVLTGCQSTQSGSPTGSGGNANAGSGGEEIGSLTNLADVVAKKSAEKQSAHVKMSMDAAGQSIGGEGNMRFGDQPAMEMTMSIPEMATMTMRLVDDVFYIKLPSELQPGKPWVKITAGGDDPMSKTLGSMVEQMKTNGNPAETLKQLQEAGTIKSSKKEQLGGEETTHYEVVVDVAKAVEAQKDPEMKKMLEEATKAGLTEYPMDVWLNKDNLPVKIAIKMDITAGGQSQSVTMNMDYTDWGKPVEITAPPAAEVAELPR